MSKINTNMAAVTTLYHLTNKEGSMNKALERISSGLRLNHAVDDAAGASIVNRMTSQIKGLEAAIRNAADAISLTQTAEGSLEEVTQILHRMRELSVQAANGVYTGQDRQAINNEIVAMQNELQRIAESSTFNGVKMLNGDFQDTTFQVGFQPNDTATLSIEDVRPSGLGEYILSTSNIDASTVATQSASVANKVTTAITAAEAPSSTFPSIDNSPVTGVLSNQLQAFVTANTAGLTNGGWSVAGTDASALSIDSSGVVTVTGGSDFETKASYSFDVVFTTDTGATFEEAVTLSITDLAEEVATIATPTVPASVKANDTFTVSIGGTAVTATIAADDAAFTITKLQTALNAQITTLNTATPGTIDGTFSVASNGTDLEFVFETEGDIVNTSGNAGEVSAISYNQAVYNTGAAASQTTVGAVGTPEVQTIAGPTLPAAFAVGDIVTVSVEGIDVSHTVTAAGALTVTQLATALNTANAALVPPAGWTFSATNGGADLTLTQNTGAVVTANVSQVKIDLADADLAGQVAPAYTDGVAVALTTATNADRAGSTVTSNLTTLSVGESTQVIINPLNIASPETTGVLSNAFKTFVATNPAPPSQANGGFSLSGADAAKFDISQTGIITSKAALDFDTPGSAASSNLYDLSVTYTDGTSTLSETIGLNITDDQNDAGYVSAAAQPFLGTSKSAVGSLISEVEDLTIYGNVGTKVIDINGGSSARDVVTAVNAVQGETGVYANAQTRLNITFPDQAEALSDTVSFKLFGKNALEQVISGNVDLGVVNGRDASLRNLADAVNSASGATGITAKVSTNGATLSLVSNEGYDIVIEGYAMSASTLDMNVSAANQDLESIGIQQAMQEGSANKNSMRVSGVVEFHSPYIFSVSTDAVGNDGGGLFQQIPGAAKLSSVADLNVLTVANAQRMLTAVDGALVRVDLERSDLGATMSRMEHTIANLSNINLNTKAARSRIQDADIAAETVELNRTQVLSQAAQAMLAQANRTSQSILSLLQG